MTKRKNHATTTDGAPYNKRLRPSTYDDEDDKHNSYTQGRLDPVFGQRGAFPGLDSIDGDDEIFYGPPSDGMEYLKMVRLEARGVPTILTAPKDNIPDAGDRENSGDIIDKHHNDEIYMDRPADYLMSDQYYKYATDAELDPQDEYYQRLLTRFNRLRRTLQCQPPAEAVANLGDDALISLPVRNKRASAAWKEMIRYSDPSMVHLASIDTTSALNALPLLSALLVPLVTQNSPSALQLVFWTWGLLARCRDITEMQSDDVSLVRELGKTAVGLLISRRTGTKIPGFGDGAEDGEKGSVNSYELLDAYSDVGEDLEDEESVPVVFNSSSVIAEEESLEVESDKEEFISQNYAGLNKENQHDDNPTIANYRELENAKARLQAQLVSETLENRPDGDNTVVEEDKRENNEEAFDDKQLDAALDMIITVVGEIYRQRDLLEFRELWVDQ
ncbi:MAG: hypothetical protein M1834_000442 [Cirrosporium novae-zelandiae]|nr:MAG: hypothetical protein M1834_000442 [Cirrosporium novae-zelandiae]